MNDLPDVWNLLIEDMQARHRLGLLRYNRPVRPCNGRDALQDLLEELLDALVYCKQYHLEKQMLAQELRNLLDLKSIASVHQILSEILHDYFPEADS